MYSQESGRLIKVLDLGFLMEQESRDTEKQFCPILVTLKQNA